MKLLLDECVDRRLSRDLTGHEVRTVTQMGWTGIANGELLRLAAVEFDVFITVDRNLTFQQVLPKFDISIIVLCAPSNRLSDLRPLVSKMLDVLPTLPGGMAEYIRL